MKDIENTEVYKKNYEMVKKEIADKYRLGDVGLMD